MDFTQYADRVKLFHDYFILSTANDVVGLYPGAKRTKYNSWMLPCNAFPLQTKRLARPQITPSGRKLKEHQIVGVERILASPLGHLVFDDVGLGKTLEVLHALKLLGRDYLPFLVVAIKPGKKIWADIEGDARKHYNFDVQVLETRSPDFDSLLATRDGYFVNYAVLPDWMDYITTVINPRVIIADEVHEIRNIRTHAAKAVKRLSRLKSVKKRIGLSASPIANDLIDLYTQLDFIQPGHWGTYVLYDENQVTSFATRYCNAHQDEYGWQLSGVSHTSELTARLKNAVTRRTYFDVHADLPQKKRVARVYSRDDIDITEYEKVERGIFDGALKAGNRGVEIQRLGRLAEVLSRVKVPLVLREVKARLEASSDCIIIFCYFYETAKQLIKCLRAEHGDISIIGPYSSKVTEKKQLDCLESLRLSVYDKRKTVFVATLKCAGTASNDFVVADTLINADLFWVPYRFIQGEGRLCRMGQLNENVDVIYILVKDTIDMKMFEHLKRKATAMAVSENSGEGLSLIDSLGGALDAECVDDLLKDLKNLPTSDLELL